MSLDDLDVGKCPICGNDMVETEEEIVRRIHEKNRAKWEANKILNEIFEKVVTTYDYERQNIAIDVESGYTIEKPYQDYINFLSWLTEKFERLREVLKTEAKP